jgi:hypothetical protein
MEAALSPINIDWGVIDAAFNESAVKLLIFPLVLVAFDVPVEETKVAATPDIDDVEGGLMKLSTLICKLCEDEITDKVITT